MGLAPSATGTSEGLETIEPESEDMAPSDSIDPATARCETLSKLEVDVLVESAMLSRSKSDETEDILPSSEVFTDEVGESVRLARTAPVDEGCPAAASAEELESPPARDIEGEEEVGWMVSSGLGATRMQSFGCDQARLTELSSREL